MCAAKNKIDALDMKVKGAENEALEKAIRGCQMGDWNAKNALARIFHPLLLTLAEKRCGVGQVSEINKTMEKGRHGLFEAAMRFKLNANAQNFRVFALPYIEKRIDGRRSFWERLFGSR